jgi:hypothetical protein
MLRKAEIHVLEVLEWDCQAHFVPYDVLVDIFKTCGFIFDSDKSQSTVLKASDKIGLLIKADRYVELYTKKCMKDITFAYTNQYTVGCAIISAARTKCKLEPIWPEELAQLTGLQHHHFIDVEQQVFDSVAQQLQQSQSRSNKHTRKSEHNQFSPCENSTASKTPAQSSTN